MRKYSEEKWTRFGIQMLRVAGLTRTEAETIVEVLITGSLRGIDSHGVRALPYFTKKRRRGRMKILRRTSGTALLDANGAWGPVSARRSMDIAIEMARRNGIGSCSVVNGDWITNLSWFSMMAVQHSMIGMVFAREGPVCAPWGGTKSVMGTNPMSIAIPTGGKYPIVLDFATTIAAQGHVKTLLLEGKPIPEGWLLDRNGNPVSGRALTLETLDEFWKTGSLLPFGTYKGYGINLVIDILGGALNLTGTGSRAKGQGTLSLAIKISAFSPVKKFEEEVTRLIEEIKASPVRPGFDEVLLPGEREYRLTEERKREGIPIDEQSWQDITKTCDQLGLNAAKLME